MLLKLRRRNRFRRWVKKHRSAVIIGILIPLILYFASAYQTEQAERSVTEQVARESRNRQSQIDVIYKAIQENMRGGHAEPRPLPDGSYSVARAVTVVPDSLSVIDCVQVIVRKANGTIISSGPLC